MKIVTAILRVMAFFIPGTANADVGVPVVGGDTLLVVGGLLAVVILWLVIRGALSVTRNDTSDEDPAGVGILDGIDEDDDKPAKKKK